MHRPVLLKEVMELMAIKADGMYVDGTLGSGGHAQAVLQKLGPAGRFLGIDRDEEALARARELLGGWESQCVLVHGNYSEMGEIAANAGFDRVDGVLLDLGVSSDQIDTPERGFSFQTDGPLDMRMDRSQTRAAADLINETPEADLRRILWILGEEKAARRIARAIVRERDRLPIKTTMRLATIVEKAKGGRRGRIHLATKSFQAFRMAVNEELENLDQGLEAAINLLKVHGRLAVISFHSLEDRAVKHLMAEHVGRRESLQAGGEQWTGVEPRLAWVRRKHVMASEEELKSNPRSRSAKLRVVERIGS